MITKATSIVQNADILLVIGTSLNVYPAAGLMQYRNSRCKTWYIDPKPDKQKVPYNIQVVSEIASKGLSSIMPQLIENAK
jgi:NAD-dependent deacetylase